MIPPGLRALTMLVFCAFSGCAASTGQGNFAKTDHTENAVIVADAARGMSIVYPPASTTLKITSEVKDNFGVAG
jgi:hypothetical protein